MLYQRSCLLYSFTRPLGCGQFNNRTHPSALSLLATQTLTLRLVLLAVALICGQPRAVYSDPFLLWCNYDNTHAFFAYLSSRRFTETLCEIRQKTIQIPTSQLKRSDRPASTVAWSPTGRFFLCVQIERKLCYDVVIEATYNPRTIAPEDVRDHSLRIQSLRILLTRLHHLKTCD